MEDDTLEIFSPGSVVVLNSGGPPMTVECYDDLGVGLPMYQCGWFTADGEYRTDLFAAVMLSPLVEDEDLN